MAQLPLQNLVNRSCRITVISDQDQIRKTLLKNLRLKGYKNVMVQGSLGEFISQKGWEKTQWLITPPERGKQIDILRVLKKIINSRAQTRVSVLLYNKDVKILESAFRNGLLSWFGAEDILVSDESFRIQLDRFLLRANHCLQSDLKEALLTAIYFRKALTIQKSWESLINLELDLCHRFSNKPETLVKLAEAYLLAGEFHQGRIILDKVKQINSPDTYEGIERLTKNYPQATQTNPSTAAKNHIDSAFVIEADDTEYSKILEGFAGIGLTKFFRFPNFQEAWNALQHGPRPDIIITEWTRKSKDLNSEQFLQRVRGKFGTRIPFLLLISSVPARDYQLITDMRVLQLIKKPVRQHNFLMALTYVIEQHRNPTEPKTQEIKIEQLLRDGDNPYIQFLRGKFLSDKTIDPKRKFYIESYYHFQRRDYQKAKDLLMKGIKIPAKETDSHILPNLDKKILLSSCFQHLQDLSSAIKLLEIAHKDSPLNVEVSTRLALLLYQHGEPERAKELLEGVESQDPGHPEFISAKTQIAVFEGHNEHAEELLQNAGNIIDIIAAINSQAVKKIKDQEFDTGFKIYRTLIRSIPESVSEYQGIVYYNLSLAYLKSGMEEEAEKTLKAAMGYRGSKTSKKAAILLKKLEQAQKQGKDIKRLFQDDDHRDESDIDETDSFTIGLHGILNQIPARSRYKQIKPADEQVKVQAS
ncbi:tetratricopeptide repeat protein [Pseudobacteriovorax antillogorgiicola]|uniref:Tetratricopeptide repeat-containing protein n=1 Tax=Pseudobacteriovorax antillogorgiicola TaxID=1513793 RepID=A0A1Y6C4D5_9BACT|nr:tetratricopeptide repeat protein [Pseudobacteriovorax antillogorgiicola]TCS51252.1 tetratricopeptide repeat protein [Pseudobacteriovorax antillogorgiicola]SMF36495.1 Tetratricopeptide repeat-containing protein [Pseudobacteriovorax antillogorgiicola]